MSNLIGIVSALCIVLLVANIVSVEGHGMLLNPPARSSAWREDPARFPAYYQDNQMFCGGFNTQWNINSNAFALTCVFFLLLVQINKFVFCLFGK